MRNRQDCPDCRERHLAVCRCDHRLCKVCDERWVHIDDAESCSTCDKVDICEKCFELVVEKVVCTDCQNAIEDFVYRLHREAAA